MLLEKFKPSGDFEKDFVELGAVVGFPSIYISPRPKRPVTPQTASPDNFKGKDGKISFHTFFLLYLYIVYIIIYTYLVIYKKFYLSILSIIYFDMFCPVSVGFFFLYSFVFFSDYVIREALRSLSYNST